MNIVWTQLAFPWGTPRVFPSADKHIHAFLVWWIGLNPVPPDAWRPDEDPLTLVETDTVIKMYVQGLLSNFPSAVPAELWAGFQKFVSLEGGLRCTALKDFLNIVPETEENEPPPLDEYDDWDDD